MSHSANSVSTDRPFATSFFGGADRGKVVQVHLMPQDLNDQMLTLVVYDTDYQEVTTLGDWLKLECASAKMVLFDPYAPPKVSSVLIEVR